MNHIQNFWRQVLWLSVIIVPIPAGAFAVHTPDSLLACFLSYTILALLVPFFYFSFQRAGYGMVWGGRRRGPHLVLTSAVLTVFWMILWFFIGKEEALWKSTGMILGTVLFAVLLVSIQRCSPCMRKSGQLTEKWPGGSHCAFSPALCRGRRS